MPNATAGYGRFSDSIAFLGIFIHYNMFHSFIKLLQIVAKMNEKQTYVIIYGYVWLFFDKDKICHNFNQYPMFLYFCIYFTMFFFILKESHIFYFSACITIFYVIENNVNILKNYCKSELSYCWMFMFKFSITFLCFSSSFHSILQRFC